MSSFELKRVVTANTPPGGRAPREYEMIYFERMRDVFARIRKEAIRRCAEHQRVQAEESERTAQAELDRLDAEEHRRDPRGLRRVGDGREGGVISPPLAWPS